MNDRHDVAGVLGAAVAHELRNILATAASSIFLARRHVDDRPRLLGLLDAAEAETQRAQDVIDRVLRLVRGEPIHRESVRVLDIVLAARRNVLGLSEQVQIDVVPSELVLSCEPLLVERLITNLIANASEAQANVPDPHILVRVRPDERGVVLDVDDDGPGFAPTIMDRLFEPGLTTKQSGTGLGLSLCRSIVRAHGGDMSVARSPLGGARVRCMFVEENPAG